MFDEEWDRTLNYDFGKIADKEEILAIMEEYLEHYYQESDTE